MTTKTMEGKMQTIEEQIMEQDLLPIWDRLLLVRRYRGITQTELAKDLGISTMGLSYFERGKRKLSVDFLIRWAGRLGLSFEMNFKNL